MRSGNSADKPGRQKLRACQSSKQSKCIVLAKTSSPAILVSNCPSNARLSERDLHALRTSTNLNSNNTLASKPIYRAERIRKSESVFDSGAHRLKDHAACFWLVKLSTSDNRKAILAKLIHLQTFHRQLKTKGPTARPQSSTAFRTGQHCDSGPADTSQLNNRKWLEKNSPGNV